MANVSWRSASWSRATRAVSRRADSSLGSGILIASGADAGPWAAPTSLFPTTEIVADRMQMLGSREGSGAPVAAEPSERASTAEPRGGAKGGAAPAKKNVDELDDDIVYSDRTQQRHDVLLPGGSDQWGGNRSVLSALERCNA